MNLTYENKLKIEKWYNLGREKDVPYYKFNRIPISLIPVIKQILKL